MVVVSWGLGLFLLVCLAYLLLAYALRWYEITNQPAYWNKYGNRTLFKTGWQGPTLFLQEYIFLVIHLWLLVMDYLLWPYYCYWRKERYRLVRDGRFDLVQPESREKTPVILVHGYMMRGGTLWHLRRRLRRDGWQVWLFNYGPAFENIARFAQQLQEAVEQVMRQTGQKKVDLVGHSMGGLIIRYYLSCLAGGKHVRHAVSLGTPHNGTKLWAFSLGRCGQQMRPDSKFLQELRAKKIPPQTKFTCIYSDFDELISPHESGRLDLPGVINSPVCGLGHVGLIFADSAYNMVREALLLDH